MDGNLFKRVKFKGRKVKYRCMCCGKDIKDGTVMYHNGEKASAAEIILCASCKDTSFSND